MAERIQHVSIPIEQLEESVRVNVRAGLNAHAVDEYQHTYENGGGMPAVVVFCEKGTKRYIMADGRHRKAAAEAAGIEKLDVELHEGDETDALKYALACNTEHGVRRTPYDLKTAVHLLVQNKRLMDQYRTTTAKAELLRCSERTIHRLLAEWREVETADPAEHNVKSQAREQAKKYTPPPIPATRGGNSAPKQLDDTTADLVTALDVIASAKSFDAKKLAASGAFSVRVIRRVADRIFSLLEQLE